ncbi:MAG: metallophosphoesterase [Planctomycetes bacterium]|nr:metallophosphoesterase [Planctomycetota bacterium]
MSADLGIGESIRLVYASDLHMGLPWTSNMGSLLADAVVRAEATTLLLGGDLVNHWSGTRMLERAVALISREVTVAAVPGNHDRRSAAAVRSAVIAGGGRWLPDDPLMLANGRLRIDGALRRDPLAPGVVRVLCAHEPDVFTLAARIGYPLVLAGHLHGCQFVGWSRGGRMFPGAWFFPWNGRQFERDGAKMWVSVGCGDAIPARWNCPREVLVCDLR